MLEAAKRPHTSPLIPFIPRQVIMLGTATKRKETAIEDKKKQQQQQRGSEALEDGQAAPRSLVLDRGKAREILLGSIAAYLGSNGFSKTLAALRSEAQLPTDGGKTSALNLEDLFCKFLESRSFEDTSIDWPREQDSGKVSIRRKDKSENILDASEHNHRKKRKNRDGVDDENRDGVDDGTKDEVHKPGLQDVDETDFSKSVSIEDLHVKTKGKKKKKKKKAASDSLEDHHLEGSDGLKNIDHESHFPKSYVNDKEERKKKQKIIAGHSDEKTEHGDNVQFRVTFEEKVLGLKTLVNNSSTLSAESNLEHRNEKKKKTKRSSDTLAGNSEPKLEALQELTDKKSEDLKSLACESNSDFKLLYSVTKDASIKNELEITDSKSKAKKKKRGKPNSESLDVVESDKVDGGTSHDGKDGCATSHKVRAKSGSGKEGILVSEENVDKEKIFKKRKRLVFEERASQAENALETKDSENAKMDCAEVKSLQGNEYLTTSKKIKKEKSNENFAKTAETFSSEELNILNKHKDNPGECDSQKKPEGHRLANGDLQKEREGGTSSKAVKKEKLSAEPIANAFRRVKVEEIKFADKRLQDNSYWAKDGADSGYGAKAQEILGQVRGREFRHEKTKKKRGTYRGGQLDIHSHSIKFNYSDEE